MVDAWSACALMRTVDTGLVLGVEAIVRRHRAGATAGAGSAGGAGSRRAPASPLAAAVGGRAFVAACGVKSAAVVHDGRTALQRLLAQVVNAVVAKVLPSEVGAVDVVVGVGIVHLYISQLAFTLLSFCLS